MITKKSGTVPWTIASSMKKSKATSYANNNISVQQMLKFIEFAAIALWTQYFGRCLISAVSLAFTLTTQALAQLLGIYDGENNKNHGHPRYSFNSSQHAPPNDGIAWVWPLPVTVTTRNTTFLVGDSYKPPFATVTGTGPHSRYSYTYSIITSLS